MSTRDRISDFAPEVRDSTEADGVRPSGQQIFDAKTTEEQDALFGPEKAALVRSGEVALADLIDHSPIKHGDDILTERPLEALGGTDARPMR